MKEANISKENLEKAIKQKREQNGAFENKVYLILVQED